MAHRFIRKVNADRLDSIYNALVEKGKATPLVKVARTDYFYQEVGGHGLVTATHRVLFGDGKALAKKVTKAGFVVRSSGQDQWSAYVSFDVPTGTI